MKKGDYTELICRGFCRFYKEGKEGMNCGSYVYLSERLAPEELKREICDIGSTPEFSCDEQIRKLVCERCEFLADGCDFREGLDSPPCGGYNIIERLFIQGRSGGKREPSAE